MASDLRTFLLDVGDGLLRVPKPVELENLSALINQSSGPVLFERIHDYPDWQIADLLMCNRRSQAKALGVSPDDLLPNLAQRLRSAPKTPNIVETAPCKEMIQLGDNASLTSIPSFQHGEDDMGPVLIGMTNCRDPESGNQNMAWTRMTPLSPHMATYFIGSSPHMLAILTEHEKRGENMPMSFVMGVHPAYEIMGSYSVLNHIGRFGELDMVSALLEEDIEIIACETQPLHVPARCEVVIEGFVYGDGRRVDEGPGPSQALYYLPGVTQQPVFEMTAITRRKKPILRQINTLLYTDHQSLLGLPHEAMLYEALNGLDITVHEVLYTPWSGTQACVVQVTPEYDGQVMDMLLYVLAQRFPNVKVAIAVDSDVDIESPADLHWSIATRVEPADDILILPNLKGHRIDPKARPVENAPRRRLTGKMAINATKPPLSRSMERHEFRKTWPLNWGKADLKDYL